MRNMLHPSLIIFLLAGYASFHSGQAFRSAVDRSADNNRNPTAGQLILERQSADHLLAELRHACRADPDMTRGKGAARLEGHVLRGQAAQDVMANRHGAEPLAGGARLDRDIDSACDDLGSS